MAIRVAESLTGDSLETEPQLKSPPRKRMWLGLSKFLRKDGYAESKDSPVSQWTPDTPQGSRRNWSKRVPGVGLPRPATFKRQNSERREHLEPVNPSNGEKRALSQSRQRAFSLGRPRACSSPPPIPCPRISAPAVTHSNDFPELSHASTAPTHSEERETLPEGIEGLSGELQKAPSETFSEEHSPSNYEDEERDQLNAELDSRWILNLSMHFRDKSDREKFFITFAQERTLWRRVTVSCDYRRAEPDSLEMDLKELHFQRDKSGQIYEAIRDSLPDIQFYDTVTNLKLETTDGRLHVHVTEDVNEIIPYPPISSVSHLLEAVIIRESEIAFDSHLSGFVYRVKYRDRDFIKKEIPGPDTVDEFLYELNALYSIRGSRSVIDFKGIIVDDNRKVVKGVLIDFAEQGALVDLIYDYKGKVDLKRRLRWARQIVSGLQEIHEAGFVQGDLTLSNIVIDKKDNAKIIDINRRGCPVGWEPPEIAAKIASNQRISMYIGVKSDLYQLGMTLWGIAVQEDEPERCERDLDPNGPLSGVPSWYQHIIKICLSERPQDRLSAKELSTLFQADQQATFEHPYSPTNTAPGKPKRYIEPSAAVEREDLERFSSMSPHQRSYSVADHQSAGETLIPAPSTTYRCDSSDSIFNALKDGHYEPDHGYHHFEQRGRRRSREDEIDVLLEEDDLNVQPHIVSVSPDAHQEHAEIELDGNSYIIDKSSFDPEDFQVLVNNFPNSQGQPLPVTATQEWVEKTDQAEAHTHDRSTHSESSKTSQSTPRNAPALTDQRIEPVPLSVSMTDDLIGWGRNPALDEHSPDEPKVVNPFSTYASQAKGSNNDYQVPLDNPIDPELQHLGKDDGIVSADEPTPNRQPMPLQDSVASPSDSTPYITNAEPTVSNNSNMRKRSSSENRTPVSDDDPVKPAIDTSYQEIQFPPSEAASIPTEATSINTSEADASRLQLIPDGPIEANIDANLQSNFALPTISVETPNSSKVAPTLPTSNSDFDSASDDPRQQTTDLPPAE